MGVPYTPTGKKFLSTSQLGLEAMFEAGRTSFDGAGKEPGLVGRHPEMVLLNASTGEMVLESVPAITLLGDKTISPSWLDPMPVPQAKKQKQQKQHAAPARPADKPGLASMATAFAQAEASKAPQAEMVTGQPVEAPAEVLQPA